MKEDSIEGIFDTLHTCALISKSAGGIGLHIHNIRATGSCIAGTNGISNGLVPMLRVYNNVARYIDQGGNKVLGYRKFTAEAYSMFAMKISLNSIHRDLERSQFIWNHGMPIYSSF